MNGISGLASDNVAVTGYLISEAASAPSAADTGWSASVPSSYTFQTAGAKTLYLYAKDAAGNIAAPLSESVVLSLPDATKPYSTTSRYGATLVDSRYNLNGGPMQTVFYDGAADAYKSGLRTLKLWLDWEVVKKPYFYMIPSTELSQVTTQTQLIQLPEYQKVLDLPFTTIFLLGEALDVTNPITERIGSTALTDADLKMIYQETYDLSVYLLQRYRGTGKTFILQNHEGDWHISVAPTSLTVPSAVGLANYQKYWTARQKAVQDARSTIPSDVKVFHLCEVVNVVPSVLDGTHQSLTRDVLPQVTCDLVGYSSYDSVLNSDPTIFSKALAYIQSKANPSPVFGTNQVAISEIGVPEAVVPDQIFQTVRALRQAMQQNLPYVLSWAFWDDGCRQDLYPNCYDADQYTTALPLAELAGFWMHKPDGSNGEVFDAIQDYVGSANGIRFQSLNLSVGDAITFGSSETKQDYSFVMQADGNLVIYHQDSGGSSAVWNSGTFGKCQSTDVCIAAYQRDGNLVLYKNGAAYWSSNTGGGSGKYLQLLPAAPYLRILDSGGKPLSFTGSTL